jgi:glutathione S-transferase
MPRRLFTSERSPFGRKVRIVLHQKGLSHELVPVDLAARTPEFSGLSPLGKVPVFVDDDGTVVFDSTVIVEYLEDRHPERLVLGADPHTRLWHRSMDELGDTIADQAVALFFADAGATAVRARAERALDLALDEVTRRLEADEQPDFGLGHAAVIAGIGYLVFRHGAARIAARPALVSWLAENAERESVRAAPGPTPG